jgi:hypothetical protein
MDMVDLEWCVWLQRVPEHNISWPDATGDDSIKFKRPKFNASEAQIEKADRRVF